VAIIDLTDVLYESVEPTADLPYVLRVHLVGHGFVQRAAPVIGAVGDQALAAVIVDQARDAASGFLRSVPPAGAVVRVGYLDTGLADTDFTFPQIPNA
jgi:hypothetical protein